MPSNAELITSIEALAAELKVEAVTEGLSNAKLADLLAELREKKATPDAEAARIAAEAEAKPPYYVAPGKSVTSKRGILDGDAADEVEAKDFEGGQAVLDDLVELGVVIKS